MRLASWSSGWSVKCRYLSLKRALGLLVVSHLRTEDTSALLSTPYRRSRKFQIIANWEQEYTTYHIVNVAHD